MDSPREVLFKKILLVIEGAGGVVSDAAAEKLDEFIDAVMEAPGEDITVSA